MLHFVLTAASWLIGVVGVGGAIGAIAATVTIGPAATFAIVGPIVSRFLACAKCVAVVVFVLSTVGSYWVGRHGEYHRGYDAAVSDIAEENAATISLAVERRRPVSDCKARNGTWNQTTRRCQ